MAGSLKPSTVTDEAEYTYLEGKTASGSYNRDGSGLFDGIITEEGTNNQGYYYNKISNANDYIAIKTEETCNIYAHISLNNRLAQTAYNYAASGTGKLRILQYDGTDYTIDITDKYWIGRKFSYTGSGNASSDSNGLTFEQFVSTELIDSYWQKIVANLPPGQYKFVQYESDNRGDNEWFLEKVIKYSQRVKEAIVGAIQGNELISRIITAEIKED